MAAIIKIENLYKIYPVGRERVVALGGINLKIEKGQICCILGTSGSGKSTLLNQLAGLEKPTRGRVLIGGVNISSLSEGQLAFAKKMSALSFSPTTCCNPTPRWKMSPCR